MSVPIRWHPLFHAFIRRLYFSRVRVIGGAQVPPTGPVLAVCLHRNGAVDGFVYRKALPLAQYLIKASLRQSVVGRGFFDGVEVTRPEDGGKQANFEAIEECLTYLTRGGWLAIFPEGTSALGPRHLPFKSGAARIALRHLDSGRPLTVLPLGIHYECAWSFRSRAEIIIGPPVSLEGLAADSSAGARLQEMKRRLTIALEAVGANFSDAAAQRMAEKFAYIATLGTRHGYFEALKKMERQLPPVAVNAWECLQAAVAGRRVLRHQGVPLFPMRRPLAYMFSVLFVAPLVVAGFIVNAPPLAVAWWAGRHFPDDTNVIALWRILAGVPVLILWAAAWCALGLVAGYWWLPVLYFSLTWLAAVGWYRLKKLAVVAWNGLFHADLRPLALAVRQAVLTSIDPPPMNPRRLPQLRLHEWALGLFLIVTAARLGVAGAWLPALAFGGMAAAVPTMAAVAARWPGPACARVRLLLLPVWVNLAYFRLGEAATCLKLDSYDAALLRMDRFWLGATPAAWLGAWSHPVLTEFLSACYLLFFPAVLAAFLIVMIHPETVGVKLFDGLITIYAVGFLGYTLVPAAGPYLAMVALPPPPAGYFLTQFNADLVAGGSNRVDVFPSLHVAITVFLMGTLWQRRRRLFFALLIPAAGLCGATLYLRFHYAVDLAAGLVLAGGGLWLAARSLPTDEPHP